MFLRQSIREHRIPFEIKLETSNIETLAAIEEGERLLKDPETKKFTSVEELFEELNN
jgi:DNA-damage-inducible protein J